MPTVERITSTSSWVSKRKPHPCPGRGPTEEAGGAERRRPIRSPATSTRGTHTAARPPPPPSVRCMFRTSPRLRVHPLPDPFELRPVRLHPTGREVHPPV